MHPYAALAEIQGEKIKIQVMYSENNNEKIIKKTSLTKPSNAINEARKLAQDLIKEYSLQ